MPEEMGVGEEAAKVLEVVVTKEDVCDTHPLQYKFKTFVTIKDINNVDVQVEKCCETKNTVELDAEIASLQKQIVDIQASIAKVEAKKTLIAGIQ